MVSVNVRPSPLGGWCVLVDGETVAHSYHQTSWDAENAASAYLSSRGGGELRVCDEAGAIQQVKRWTGDGDGAAAPRAPRWEPPRLKEPWSAQVPRGLTIDTRRLDDVLVVEATGELDLSTVPELIEKLRDTGDVKGVVVDFMMLTFMDSSGLHAMLAARRRLGSRGQGVAVACPPGAVRRILELTGTEALLEVRDDLEDALAAARSA
jgi:stage II sporulation protein AA (anti-sigma F factor antagonist)